MLFIGCGRITSGRCRPALIVNAFLPWMTLGEEPVGGVPIRQGSGFSGSAFLRCCSPVSASGPANSRHPIPVVGLTAFAITFLGYQWLSRSVPETAWARAHARAIVEGVPAGDPRTVVGVDLSGLGRRRRPRRVRVDHRHSQSPRPYAKPGRRQTCKWKLKTGNWKLETGSWKHQ